MGGGPGVAGMSRRRMEVVGMLLAHARAGARGRRWEWGVGLGMCASMGISTRTIPCRRWAMTRPRLQTGRSDKISSQGTGILTHIVGCGVTVFMLTTCWRFPSIREFWLFSELIEHSMATALDMCIGMDGSADPMHSILAIAIPVIEFITEPSARC